MAESRRHVTVDVHGDGSVERRDFERSAPRPPVRLIVDASRDREEIERLLDAAVSAIFGERRPPEPSSEPKLPRRLRRTPAVPRRVARRRRSRP